jgi:hypothetical protein
MHTRGLRISVNSVFAIAFLAMFVVGGDSVHSESEERNSSRPLLIKNGFMSGNVWRELSRVEQRSYGMGIIDGMLVMAGMRSQDGWIAECVNGMNSSQPEAMLRNEIEAHPESWHQHTAHVSMYTALLHACPQSPYHEEIRKSH